MFRSPRLLLCSVSITAVALGSPAFAQEPGTEPAAPSETQQCELLPTQEERDACRDEAAESQGEGAVIVVTGSRIRTSAFTSPDPITIIDPELELKAGKGDTAEILQTNPVAAGSFQITSLLSAGSFVTNGGVGAQTIGLRGLGPERTLVLVNSRRAGPAGTRGAIAGFDLNVLPSSLIQSAEILKTGASSVYGSDAIAGVVNLKTKKATDGLEVRGFSTLPFKSGGETYNVSAAYGREFSRGHIIVAADYFRRNELERGDRSYFGCPEEFVFSPEGGRMDILDPRTGKPRCNAFFSNSLAISTQSLQAGITSGTLLFNSPGTRLDEFLIPLPNTATREIPDGFFPISHSCSVAILNSDPALAQRCRDSVGLSDPGLNQVQNTSILPKLERLTFWADGSFEVNDNVTLVGEFLYNRRKTHTDGVRQLFFTQFSGQTLGTTSTATPAVRCTPALIEINPNCDPTSAGDPFNAGFVGNFFLQPVIAIHNFRKTDVDYYRAVGGVQANLGGLFGSLFSGWNFDSYVQYSRSDGDLTDHRIFTDAIRLQENRSRACQPGQVTSIRGVPCMDIDFTDPRVLRGEFTQAESDFLFGQETGNTLYTQVAAEASVSGKLFDLPAGPAGVAFGVHWRRDEIDDMPGDITLSGNVHGQSVSGRTAGFSRTSEAFGEVQVPLIHNTPFIQNLTLSAAARLTNNYAERNDGENDRDKNNWTYKVGVNWQVNDWLRFRGSYGTSFRAPALFEQFLADQTGFQGQLVVNPCVNFSQREPQDLVRQRCEALGLPADFNQGGTTSAVVSSGGGIGVLDPETSTAKSFSVILTPSVGLWKGMRWSVAVDYFDFDVKNEITQLGPGTITFGCFESNTYPNDPLCHFFVQDKDPDSTRFGEILEISNPYLNINRQRNRGVDVTARVSQDLGRWGSLQVLGQMTWQIKDLFELFQGEIANDEGESSEPTWVGDFKLTWNKGPWSVFYGLNAIGGTSDEQDLRDLAAFGGDICTQSTLRGGLICPVFRLKPQFYHAASITRDFGDRLSLTLGVSNIFDNNPPRVSALSGAAPISNIGQVPVFGTQYDLVGRRAFVSVRSKF